MVTSKDWRRGEVECCRGPRQGPGPIVDAIHTAREFIEEYLFGNHTYGHHQVGSFPILQRPFDTMNVNFHMKPCKGMFMFQMYEESLRMAHCARGSAPVLARPRFCIIWFFFFCLCRKHGSSMYVEYRRDDEGGVHVSSYSDKKAAALKIY